APGQAGDPVPVAFVSNGPRGGLNDDARAEREPLQSGREMTLLVLHQLPRSGSGDFRLDVRGLERHSPPSEAGAGCSIPDRSRRWAGTSSTSRGRLQNAKKDPVRSEGGEILGAVGVGELGERLTRAHHRP